MAILPDTHFLSPQTDFGRVILPCLIYLIGVGPIAIGTLILLNTDQAPLKRKVIETHGPCVPRNLMDPYFYVVEIKDPKVAVCAVLIISLFAICGFCCLGLVIASAMQLRGYATKFSVQTAKMHRAFILSLTLQASSHVTINGFPMVTTVLFYLMGSLTNELLHCCIVVNSFHGVISTMSMIALNGPYRNAAKELLYKIFHPGRRPPPLFIPKGPMTRTAWLS
ncbi:unnamed protein product [Caenorhabditis auriculariae]|uniref:G protein-coupled receptor n=1 Tax=Caenorhabditis auriculariae TaxID=2777116 RepID=A0A8S1H764_9PELO|nr:unnamed protein product [Caenorhabditis auriculariae]